MAGQNPPKKRSKYPEDPNQQGQSSKSSCSSAGKPIWVHRNMANVLITALEHQHCINISWVDDTGNLQSWSTSKNTSDSSLSSD